MLTPGEAFDTAGRAWRFATGLRRYLRAPVSETEALAWYADHVARRQERLLRSFDRLVWPLPASPYHPLLEHAGLDRDRVRDLVTQRGVEGALESLRDNGVFITYEEYMGKEPIRRGNREYLVEPTSFHNTTVVADYLGTTGGTRSSGSPVAVSFLQKRESSARHHLTRIAAGQSTDAPTAIWLPCLPSAAGLSMIVAVGGIGNSPDRWFSQIPTSMDGIPLAKRLTNTLLPSIGRVSGTRLPGPEHVPSAQPGPVLDWCISALRRDGEGCLVTYPSSAMRVTTEALDRGVSLAGLAMVLVGEPATVRRRVAIERSGATTVASYAFMQAGGVGVTCPNETIERYHVHDGKVAVIDRARSRTDGVEVPALLWTTLGPDARGVFVNVENDDYGSITRDEAPCSCVYGRLGSRTRVADVRGMSKIVASGVTVPGEVFEDMVERILPDSFGGSPGDYQFSETDGPNGGAITLRVHPGVRGLDEADLLRAVSGALEASEMGRLADGVWNPAGTIVVERRAPVQARSGKTLAYEPFTGDVARNAT